jgi:hypothetical protein
VFIAEKPTTEFSGPTALTSIKQTAIVHSIKRITLAIEIYKYLIFFKINTFLSVFVYSVKEGICINKKLSVAMLILFVSLLFCKDKHFNNQKDKQQCSDIWLWA